jgi:hypothetical protein
MVGYRGVDTHSRDNWKTEQNRLNCLVAWWEKEESRKILRFLIWESEWSVTGTVCVGMEPD